MPKSQPVELNTATVLETRVPLSKSVIWEAQQKFYMQRGIKAWTEDRVPEFITNNPFIADAYADVVFAFLQDCRSASGNDSEPPLRILEMGSGTGKFAYLFLRRLTQLLKEHDVALNGVRYRMTDCVGDLLELWRRNRYLQEFVGQGILEFECLRAEETISADCDPNQTGPLVVIANYVFDSLPQDAFVVREGKLFEVLVTATAAPGGEKGNIGQMQRSYDGVAVGPDRYRDALWNEMLSGYRSRLSDADVLFPTAALKAVDGLSQRSDGRMLLLAGDKGFTREEAFPAGPGEPTFEFHASNCFSQLVNFDAIGKYFKAMGGEALLPEKSSANFNICAFVRGRAGENYLATRKGYLALQSAFGVDDLFSVMAWLNPHIEEMSLAQILAVLRLSHWDTVTFSRIFPVLTRQARSAGLKRDDVRAAVSKVWSNYFPVSTADRELAFNCGVILLESGFFDEALGFFEHSIRELGPSAATDHNMELCRQGAERLSQGNK